jgi:hypothetical protein
MKTRAPLILALLALVGCSSPSSSAAPTPTAAGSATPAVAATPTAALKAETTSPVDLHFSGQVTGVMTHTQVDGMLCATPGGRILATLRGDVAGEPVTLHIIVNHMVAGDSQAMVAMAPPLIGPAPTPGPFGADPRALSTFAGSVVGAADGKSATISAALASGNGPIAERVTGGWTCRKRPSTTGS